MAMPVVSIEIGVDVAKQELVIQRSDEPQSVAIPNTSKSIRAWLKRLPEHAALAIEATSTYHLELAHQAHAAGLAVYVIDGLRLSNYRKSVGARAKTDAQDATLLARYLRNERDYLRAWTPPPPGHREIQSLLRRRAKLVEVRGTLRMAWGGDKLLASELKHLDQALKRIELLVEKRLRDQIRVAGLQDQVRRVQRLPGIGFLTAAGLVMSFIRGEFRSSDAFVAYLGLDLRVSQSGRWEGLRKLSKRGDSEVRRLLHNASMSGSRTATWKEFYAYHRNRGKKTTQALVILSRRLARLAYGLMKHGTEWRPQVYRGGSQTAS